MPYYSISPIESAASGTRTNNTLGSGTNIIIKFNPFYDSDVREAGFDSDIGPPPSTNKRGK